MILLIRDPVSYFSPKNHTWRRQRIPLYQIKLALLPAHSHRVDFFALRSGFTECIACIGNKFSMPTGQPVDGGISLDEPSSVKVNVVEQILSPRVQVDTTQYIRKAANIMKCAIGNSQQKFRSLHTRERERRKLPPLWILCARHQDCTKHRPLTRTIVPWFSSFYEKHYKLCGGVFRFGPVSARLTAVHKSILYRK